MVIDVVEGTALACLPHMSAVLARRPPSFPSPRVALEWAQHSGAPRALTQNSPHKTLHGSCLGSACHCRRHRCMRASRVGQSERAVPLSGMSGWHERLEDSATARLGARRGFGDIKTMDEIAQSWTSGSVPFRGTHGILHLGPARRHMQEPGGGGGVAAGAAAARDGSRPRALGLAHAPGGQPPLLARALSL